jgi:hypothetical protein
MNTNFSAQLLSEPALLASIQQAGISVNNNLLFSLVDMWIDKVHCFLQIEHLVLKIEIHGSSRLF